MGAERIRERPRLGLALMGLLFEQSGARVQIGDFLFFVLNDLGKKAGLSAEHHRKAAMGNLIVTGAGRVIVRGRVAGLTADEGSRDHQSCRGRWLAAREDNRKPSAIQASDEAGAGDDCRHARRGCSDWDVEKHL